MTTPLPGAEKPLLLPPPKKRPHLKIPLIVFFIAVVLIAGIGIATRASEERDLKKRTQSDAVLTVNVMTAQKGAQDEEIILPGTVQAWHEAIIYARTSGYLKSWATDIGAHVKEGDVLAEIDAPDLDAQYHQAQADLVTAQANNNLAQITAKRWIQLYKTDSVSKQDVDTKVATAAADQATVDSQKANLDHLQQEEDFKKVIAPFDGVITQRNTDVGALINGDSSTTTSVGSSTGQDLFHIAQNDKLRVYVQVPENNASAVTPDMAVSLYFPQNPQQSVMAKLSRTADALDPVTRSLTIELEVDNADSSLLSGGFTDAHLKLPTPKDTVILPVNTLLFRDVERVGVVKDNHVSLKPVTIGRDYGKTVEVVSGVEVGDAVILNPPDSLEDGVEVRIATPSKDKKSAENEGKDQKNEKKDDTQSK